jgi:ATP-dependent Lhr-like helicase
MGPTTGAADLGTPGRGPSDVEAALARLEMEGSVLRGRFRIVDDEATQWCDRRLLARINRHMLDGLRREIEPVSAADCLRFLFRLAARASGQPAPRPTRGWRGSSADLQGVRSGGRRLGARDPSPHASSLRHRAGSTRSACPGGVSWGRLAARPAGGTPSRAAPIALVRRADLPWLLAPDVGLPPEDDRAVAGRARTRSRSWRGPGRASSTRSSRGRAACARRSKTRSASSCPRGRVTGDGFSGLRALISATQTRGGARARWHARWNRRTGAGARRRGPLVAAALARRARRRRRGQPGTRLADETRHEALARQYVKRYGVVFRDLLARETQAPPWRDLVRIYRRSR